MYLHLGHSVVVDRKDIIGIFDLDNTTSSHRTRAFLERAERDDRVAALFDDLPRSFILMEDGKVYLSQLSTSALLRRAESGSFE